jgi:CheY-like chemotaxis protein
MAKVLIAEDDPSLRRIIALNLSRRGHSLAEADTVAAADEAVAAWEHGFEVILLDVTLPDPFGWDLLRHFAEHVARREDSNGRGPPKVIVKAALRPPQARIDEFHPDAVLVKPFPLEALFRLIDRLLGSTFNGTDFGETGEPSTGLHTAATRQVPEGRRGVSPATMAM